MKRILCGIAIVAMIFAGSTVQATGLFGTETSGNVSIVGYQGAGNNIIGSYAGGEAAADYKAYGFPCASGQAGANGTFKAGTFGTLSRDFAAVNSGAQANGLFPTVNYSGKVEGGSVSNIGNTR